MFENGVLRKVFVSKRDGVTGGGENCIMLSYAVCRSTVMLSVGLLLTRSYAVCRSIVMLSPRPS